MVVQTSPGVEVETQCTAADHGDRWNISQPGTQRTQSHNLNVSVLFNLGWEQAFTFCILEIKETWSWNLFRALWIWVKSQGDSLGVKQSLDDFFALLLSCPPVHVAEVVGSLFCDSVRLNNIWDHTFCYVSGRNAAPTSPEIRKSNAVGRTQTQWEDFFLLNYRDSFGS